MLQPTIPAPAPANQLPGTGLNVTGPSQTIRRNSAWMLLSRSFRTLVAAAYFALLARALGVNGYGAFSGVCALAGIFAPFASLGSGNLLIQAVARDRREFPARWAQSLVSTCLSG